MHNDTICITIGRDENFGVDIKNLIEGGTSFYKTTRKPKQNYEYVAVFWNKSIYFFEKHDTGLGIGFKTLTDIILTNSKGFKWFQYNNKENMIKTLSTAILF